MILIGLSLHKYTFAYDFEVNGLYYNKLSNSEVEVTYKSYNDRSYTGEIHIPEKVTYNGVDYSVTSIGSRAFYGCSGLTGPLTIPNSVISIGRYAFCYCSGFTGSLTIPNSVTSIGNDAFEGCSGLTSITVENANPTYDSRNNCNALIETNTNTLILGCKNTTIPNTVTSIGGYAFFRCSGLTGSLTIPNSVTSIGNSAFFQCSGLTGSLTIPNFVTSIGQVAFNGCSGLTSIAVENTNSSYDSRNNCNALVETKTNTLILGCKNTTIPNSVTSIGICAFYGCSGLTGPLTIPNSVTSIGSNAFYNCSGLTGSLIIPNSVTSIGSYAFWGTTGIDTVKSEIDEPFTIDSNVFGSKQKSTLQVPKGSKSKYIALTGWTQYFNEVVEYGESLTYTLSITATGNGSASYNGNSIREETRSFTVNEGTSAVINFSPDNGYKIKNVKLNRTNVTFDFDNEYTKLIPTLTGTSSGNSHDGDFTVATTSTAVSGFTVTVSAADEGVSNANRIWSGAPRLRMYSGTFTVSGKGIKRIDFTGHDTNFNLSTTTGKLDGKVWTGEADEVVFFVAKITQISKLVINGDGTDDPGLQVAEATCAEVIAGIDGTKYRVTGKCTEIKNATYGNWYLEDATGTVYIYGTLDAEGKAKNFSSLGIEVGDVVTVEGPKKTYNGTVELVDVKVINITKAGSQKQSEARNFVMWNGTITANQKAATTTAQISSLSDVEDKADVGANASSIKVIKDNGFGLQKVTPDGGVQKSNSVEIERFKGRTFIDDVTDITSSVSTSQYTISNINSDTSLEVVFEAITHTLSITASGNGSVTYNSTAVRGKTQTFSINEGTSAVVKFTPDTGYKLKSVKLNGTDVTASVSNSQYTISNISSDTTLEVVFETITHTLSITASGNGSATYNSTAVRGKTQTFTVNEGTSATITFTPDAGYRIVSVKVNNTDVTANVVSNKYTISNTPCGDKFLKACVVRKKWLPLRQNPKLCCSVNSNIGFLQRIADFRLIHF